MLQITKSKKNDTYLDLDSVCLTRFDTIESLNPSLIFLKKEKKGLFQKFKKIIEKKKKVDMDKTKNWKLLGKISNVLSVVSVIMTLIGSFFN